MKKRSRLGTLVSASYLELLGGGSYAFAVYAPRIKSQFLLTQGQVQLIGTVGNVGSWLLLPAGWCFDRWGPKLGIALGMALTLGGYLFLWSILSGRTLSSVASLSLAAFVAQHGSAWWDGTAVPMASRNFPRNRGLVVGLLKGLFGISSSVITVLYQSFFRPDVAGFVCFLGLYLPSGAFLTLFGAHVSSKKGEDLALASEEKTRLYHIGYGSLALLVAFITFGSLYQKRESHKSIGIALLVVLCSFCLLMLPLEIKGSPATSAEYNNNNNNNNHSDDAPAPEKDMGYGPVLRKRSFWLLFAIMFIGMGTGITLINHVGDLVLSLDGKQGAQDTYVSIISVGSCLGRAGAGILSDKYRHRLKRTTFIVINTSIMVVGQLSLCASDLGMLYPSCAICGCSFGAFFSLLQTTLVDLYGQVDFGKVLGTAMFAPACGSLFFSTFLASTFYKRQTSEDSLHHECKGAACYRGTFFVFFLVNLLGTGLALQLRRTTKHSFQHHQQNRKAATEYKRPKQVQLNPLSSM